MIRADDCEYMGLNTRTGQHIVQEQLYPESRGWKEHGFATREEALRWIEGLREAEGRVRER